MGRPATAHLSLAQEGTVAEIFELPQLVSYMQIPELDEASAELARELATTDIRNAVGAARYDALDLAGDLARFKSIGVDLGKRKLLNPDNLRSVQIDDYTETRATETIGPPYLTENEIAEVRRLAGAGGGAFSIRPAPPARRRSYCAERLR